jgi:hypothetical protein
VRSTGPFPLDYFMWGHRKDTVYWQKSYIREELLQSMRDSAECMKGNGEIIGKIANCVLQAQNCAYRLVGVMLNNMQCNIAENSQSSILSNQD